MKTRFRAALQDLLLQDDISLESGIVKHITAQMIGVSMVNDERERFGFNLAATDYYTNDQETINFYLGNMPINDALKCLDYLKVDLKNYKLGEPATVSEDFIFNVFIPAFTVFYGVMKSKNQIEFNNYKVQSRAKLESSAIETLISYLQKALDALVPADATEFPQYAINTINALSLLMQTVHSMQKKPILYRSIIDAKESMNLVLQSPEAITDKELAKHVNQVLMGISVFEKYNRFESVLANIKFKKEIEQFVNNIQVTTRDCDIVEDTLLNLADAKLGEKGKCQYKTGYDTSRMVFKFDDMDKTNADKVIAYLQALGDVTVTEGWGEHQHGSVLLSQNECFVSNRTRQNVRLESHSIEVDGLFVYEKLLPMLQDKIKQMDTASLAKYREASKSYFEQKSESKDKASNKFGLFKQVDGGMLANATEDGEILIFIPSNSSELNTEENPKPEVCSFGDDNSSDSDEESLWKTRYTS